MAKRWSMEIRAGLVVLLGIVILVLGLFLVSGGWEQFQPKRTYTVLFRNSGGLSPGDNVYLAGQRVGQVIALDEVTKPGKEGRVLRYIAVTIEIDADKEIEKDSIFTVSQTITGIVSFHIEHGTSPELADSRTELYGERLATFEEAIHEGKLLLDDARHAVRRLDQAVARVNEILDDVDVQAIQADVRALLASLQRSGGRIQELLQRAEPKVLEALDRIDGAAQDVRALTGNLRGDWPRMRSKIMAALDNVEQATATLDAILAENRTPIRSFIQKLDDAATRVGPVLEKLEGLSREAKETLVEVRPQLVSAVRKARAAMENFKQLTEDLKTAPWKLVNKPSDRETREVHLYNAARLYIEAAGKVQRLVDDLETLQRLGALENPAAREMVAKVLQKMNAALATFEEREQRLVGLMLEPGK